MSKIFLVWNPEKTEGFFTVDPGVAYEARKGAESNCFTADGDQSELAQKFCQLYSCDQDCTIQIVEVK